MEEKQNINGNFIPGLNDIALHDVIVIHKKSRGDGGSTWRAFEKLGVVTATSHEEVTIKEPDGDSYTYTPSELDSDDEAPYVYSVSRGSDIAFEEAIRKEITRKQKSLVEMQQDLIELEDWHDTFKNSISTIGKIVRFVKQVGR